MAMEEITRVSLDPVNYRSSTWRPVTLHLDELELFQSHRLEVEFPEYETSSGTRGKFPILETKFPRLRN